MLKKYDYFFYLLKTYLPVQMHIQITMYKNNISIMVD